MVSWKRVLSVLAVLLLVGLTPSGLAWAAQSSSTNYSVDEVFFGSGGQLGVPGDGCSTNYCAKSAAGELTVGRSDSANYTTRAGFDTNREEYLQMVVNTSNIDFGILDAAETHVGTATFSVKSYLADGYQVTTAGTAPSISGHTLAPLGSPTASTVGTEQFGMNLKQNSCPGTAPPSTETGGCDPGNIGADEVQVPDNTFSFGAAASGYNTTNQYKYVDGDIIASSPKSSGETDYTISYIMNISNVTPAGTYHMVQSIVATATF